jgi:hypothetical protein
MRGEARTGMSSARGGADHTCSIVVVVGMVVDKDNEPRVDPRKVFSSGTCSGQGIS